MKHGRSGLRIRLGTVLSTPELNVLLFAFLLNYPWEFIQTPIYEGLALRGWWLSNWNYSTAMPNIPNLGVGLFPVLQWLLLPPLVAGLIGRQIRGGAR